MSKADKIDTILKSCLAQLDDCAELIRDLPLEPVRENIFRIGRVLAEIVELQEELFKLHPRLKPEGWDDPISNAGYNRMFGHAILQAEELCEAGKPHEAIKRLESFIFIGPPAELQSQAESRIRKLKSEYSI